MAGVTARTKVLLFAGLLGLVTSLLVLKFLNDYRVQAGEARLPVVVATRNIAPRTTLDESMLAVRAVRASIAPRQSFSEIPDVVGKVALTTIAGNTAIRQNDVAEKGSALGLAFAIPPYMRAVTVGVDAVIGVAGFLKPGDRVDVVASIGRGMEAQTKTVLQDVQLLALGSLIEQERLRAEGQDRPTPMGSGGKDTATLLVTPDEAERLVLAENEGKLRLVLRSVEDTMRTDLGGARMQDLIGGVAPTIRELSPAPAPAPPRAAAPRPAPVRAVEQKAPTPPPPVVKVEKPVEDPKHRVEVIRGAKIETMEVDGIQ